jgi:hypothetical protein
MAGRLNGIKEIDRWLLDREREGFLIRKVSQYVSEINGKKVNIKFNKLRRDNTFWFNTTYKRLKEMDVFVWLCGDSENYYVIPCDNMRQLIEAGSWLKKGWGNRPSFCLSLNHKYIPANIDVSSYYQNLSPLNS